MNLIAETAWHHDGDKSFFKNLVTRIARETSADYIKLHLLLDLDEYMDSEHKLYPLLREKMFSKAFWTKIMEIIQSEEKKIMLLLNDKKAIDFGLQFKPEIVEIHSVCLNDYILLDYLKERINKNIKIVLGVGGSTLDEIRNAIKLLDTENIVLMHGFQNYPTQYKDINFAKMKKIMKEFSQFEHGYADHTSWDDPDNVLITTLGAGLGMSYVEKHVTTDCGSERMDFQAAVSIEMFNKMSEKLKILEACMGDGMLDLNAAEKSYAVFGPNKKAAILTRPVASGEKITREMISFKRIPETTDLSQIEAYKRIGKLAARAMEQGHCLKKSDFLG